MRECLTAAIHICASYKLQSRTIFHFIKLRNAESLKHANNNKQAYLEVATAVVVPHGVSKTCPNTSI